MSQAEKVAEGNQDARLARIVPGDLEQTLAVMVLLGHPNMCDGAGASGHKVTILPMANDLFSFQRKLRHLKPDVVFNQYDDVIHGAIYEMSFAAMVRMMGFPHTGSPALSLGLSRYTHTTARLLHGLGIPI